METLLEADCAIYSDLKVASCKVGVEGFEDFMILIDRNAVAKWVYITPEIKAGVILGQGAIKTISNVLWKMGARGFIHTGRNGNKEGGGNYDGATQSYSHLLNFRVESADQELAEGIQELNAGKYASIVLTNNQKSEVLGRVAGMNVVTANHEIQSADTKGGFQINGQGRADAYPDYLAVYTGTAPAQVYDYQATIDLMRSLSAKQWFEVENIVVGTTTTIEINATTRKPYVGEYLTVGSKVSFRNIVGTVGTDGTNGLNNETFTVSEVIDEVTFKITANTTGLLYTSGGEAR